MAPTETASYGITIVPVYPAGARICQVIVSDVSPATLARMRASGQLDCGKRQAVTPLTVNRVSPAAGDALIEGLLANQDTDVLEFDDKEDAVKALRTIVLHDRRFFATMIDREVPCQ